MGLYDYVLVENNVDLPELPDSLIKRWGSKEQIAFQTKNTPMQYMRAYTIGNDGVLYLQEYDSVTEEKDGEYETRRENKRLEPTRFSGAIRFYESVRHEEYEFEKSQYFESGWIEYLAHFKNGVLLTPIEVIENTPAVKLTEEQFEDRTREQIKRMEEARQKMFEDRQKNPTPIQKLVDSIAKEVKLASSIPTVEDMGKALNNIELLIKEYRKDYDPHYS